MYRCTECGYGSSKWLGRCPGCGSWGSLKEELQRKRDEKEKPARLFKLSEVPEEDLDRIRTGISEFDRVLGGGIVPGSVVLIGGDPGMGKTTLLLQVADRLTRAGLSVIYASSEESSQQLKLRARRLGVSEDLLVVTETNLRSVLEAVARVSPKVLVVDSIQTIYLPELDSSSGSVSQVRECSAELVRFAKASATAVFLVGHVTKEGVIAGPKVLEHLVDVVLYFEGEGPGHYRILRAVKNRFGAVDEIGIFEMREGGLFPVSNPSGAFVGAGEGAVVPVVEGTRTFLVEVQALVTKSYLPSPRRTSVGFDPLRFSMLLAILEKFCGLKFYERDVFLNVAGGLRIREPAADLGICAVLASQYLGKELPEGTIFLGEVGLSGEVRPVFLSTQRLKEAAKHGFSRAFVPEGIEVEAPASLKLTHISHIRELLVFL